MHYQYRTELLFSASDFKSVQESFYINNYLHIIISSDLNSDAES